MSEWAEDLAQKIRTDRGNRLVEQKHFNEQQEFLKSHTPVFWRNLKDVFRKKVGMLITAMNGEEVAVINDSGSSDSIYISKKDGEGGIQVSYDLRTYRIHLWLTIPGNSSVEDYYIPDVESGKVVYKNEKNNTEILNPDVAAEKFLNRLLLIRS